MVKQSNNKIWTHRVLKKSNENWIIIVQLQSTISFISLTFNQTFLHGK